MLFTTSYNNSIVKHIHTSHSISFMQTLLWINLPFVLSLPSHLEWWLLPVVLWLLLSVTVPPIRGRKYETKLQDVCLLFLYTGSKVHCTMTSFRCRTTVEFIIEKIILTFHQYQLRLMKLLSFDNSTYCAGDYTLFKSVYYANLHVYCNLLIWKTPFTHVLCIRDMHANVKPRPWHGTYTQDLTCRVRQLIWFIQNAWFVSPLNLDFLR